MTVAACGFGPLRVEYDHRVLAPRPWTLLQSRCATRWLQRGPSGPIIELHCGAGHIGQAVAAWSGRPLVQIDDDPASCAWARRNAAHNRVAAEVWCRSVEDLAQWDGRFALVLADPPYVPSAETTHFADDPEHAIDGGDDGLAGIRACLPPAARLAAPGGAVVLQVRGPEQATAVATMRAELVPQLELRETITESTDRAVVVLLRD